MILALFVPEIEFQAPTTQLLLRVICLHASHKTLFYSNAI